MTYIEKDETCRMALKHFGSEHQMLKMVEECNELANALMHYIDNRATADDVITELADVVVMLNQMVLVFGIPQTEEEIERKYARLKGRIENERK
jgi:NTP pyrophosphatase (non-canonical NTP hydrolase)